VVRGGLLVVTPHALRQAYDLALNYSIANSIPSLELLGGLVGGCLARGLRAHGCRPPAARRGSAAPRAGRPGAARRARRGRLMALGYLRPRLFGADLFDYNGRESGRTTSRSWRG
jgi:hypothetical protein